ncbi:predicted protein [Naegleria gruberi]|uniref:Predicted protein n=1 Tax=Naegleria gruberi TaxID=5762 RepID=D2VKU0_NAEGR|nr:uncharacterized protein NAEGRDRAFT_69549 [Naegleria gruberi]EFC42498.1 predicted protein [Naegleria gruberi]|eukprot:XP_002675242.1 predicted protein [Naegleria gruberi strain NEG-M]
MSELEESTCPSHTSLFTGFDDQIESKCIEWYHQIEQTSIHGKQSVQLVDYLLDDELMSNPIGKTLAILCYSRGIGGIKTNYEKVYHILQSLGEEGEYTEFSSSMICGDSITVSVIFQTKKQILDWFSQFLTHSDTLVLLADLVLTKNPDQAFRSYEIAAEKGNIYAMRNLGDMYSFGEGSLEVDKKKSLEYFRKAAEFDDPESLFALGYYYREGIEVQVDKEKSLYYYNKAAELGMIKSISYLYGKNDKKKNYTEMVKYLRMGAEFGDASSIFNLGYAYMGNFGLSENLEETFKCQLRAANLGHGMGQHKVGYAYCNGIGVEKNPEEGVKWYLKAQNKEPASQYNLAHAYYTGVGVKMDKNIAFDWYLKAATNGHEMAKYYVGSSYYYGDGCNQDYPLAFKYLEMSAKHGYSDAQYSVGTMLLQGLGVEKDVNKAFEYIFLAADQGHERALNFVNHLRRF